MRPIIGVIGSNSELCTEEMTTFSEELGDSLMSEGFRIVTGGKGGVMEAVCRGAMNSESYFEGSTIGILPESEKKYSNNYCDIVIPSGIGISRNSIIINTADIIIAIGGGAGTLSEISFSWQKNKTILCVTPFGGWAEKLANKKIDNKQNIPILGVETIDQIIDFLSENL